MVLSCEFLRPSANRQPVKVWSSSSRPKSVLSEITLVAMPPVAGTCSSQIANWFLWEPSRYDPLPHEAYFEVVVPSLNPNGPPPYTVTFSLRDRVSHIPLSGSTIVVT